MLSTASPLQPEITDVDCTGENAIVKWTNHNHDDRNTIWGYCVHHNCNTMDDDVIGETVSLLLSTHRKLSQNGLIKVFTTFKLTDVSSSLYIDMLAM